jgi:putative permease
MLIKSRKDASNFQLVFFATIIVLFCTFVLALPRISIPLSLAYILSLALSPIINATMQIGLTKNQAILCVFILLIVSVGFPLVRVVTVLSEGSQNINYSLPRIEQYAISQFEYIRELIKLKTGYVIGDKYVYQLIEDTKSWSTGFVIRLPNFLANLMEWIFLVPFFTLFILKDSNTFKKVLLSFTPNSIFERFYYVTYAFNKQLGNYFFAKFVEAFIVGGIITTGLYVLDIQYAFILGFIAGLTNIVPYVGPFLGAIPAIGFVVVEYGITSQTLGAISLLYLIANVVDIFFVFPFLVSKIVNLHPMVVAISVIVGSHYLGITGMVISIPVVAAIKLIVTEIYNEIYTERSR